MTEKDRGGTKSGVKRVNNGVAASNSSHLDLNQMEDAPELLALMRLHESCRDTPAVLGRSWTTFLVRKKTPHRNLSILGIAAPHPQFLLLLPDFPAILSAPSGTLAHVAFR